MGDREKGKLSPYTFCIITRIIFPMPIHILPSEVASQIAAGEVIERPASVVKELIENALDAGARSISVTVEGAGQRLMEITDDGCGIPPDELALAVERHATSKLDSAEDLFSIRTLGFRGEALASIGSVSILTITSRDSSSSAGSRLRVEAGLARPVTQVGAPAGTVVRVEDLFFNVPARLKFLKKDSTERAQIDALVTRYALAYPQVRFQLRQEGRTSLQTSGDGNPRQVLAMLYGVDTARQMLEVLAEYEDMTVTGFISPLTLTRSNRREITFFVNRRPIQDTALTAALVQAYHNLLMVGRYPMAVIFLELPPEAVDVNVHPAKAEVRFRDHSQVFSGVQRAVRRALMAHTPVPTIEDQDTWSFERRDRFSAARAGWEESSAEAGTQTPGEVGWAGTASQTELPTRPIPLLRLIGQVASVYLIAEGPDGLYLIDQHAAHERVLFEAFMAQKGQPVASQTLLHPAAVSLSPDKARLLEDQLPALHKLGFLVEPFGSSTYLVRAIPAVLIDLEPAAALQVLVEDFEEDETPLEAELEAKIIARVCKRAAVKAGQTLSPEEQRALLEDLEACRSPRTCPHGRPTMIHLSVDLLERQFGRKGAR
jgi:DNA mismatch repair protein MutL